MLLSDDMGKDILRTLTLADGSKREGVRIIGFAPREYTDEEAEQFADEAVELFDAISALVGPEHNEQEIASGRLKVKFFETDDYSDRPESRYFRPHIIYQDENSTTRLILGLGSHSINLSNDFDVALNADHLSYEPAWYDPNIVRVMLSTIRENST